MADLTILILKLGAVGVNCFASAVPGHGDERATEPRRIGRFYALGDYETASFAAMKAVEVEVRRVAGLPKELLGVALMRKAFSPKDGALRDPGAEGGEQQATADLFAGPSGPTKAPRATGRSSSTTRSRRPRLSSWPTSCCASSRGPMPAFTRATPALSEAPGPLFMEVHGWRRPCSLAGVI